MDGSIGAVQKYYSSGFAFLGNLYFSGLLGRRNVQSPQGIDARTTQRQHPFFIKLNLDLDPVEMLA